MQAQLGLTALVHLGKSVKSPPSMCHSAHHDSLFGLSRRPASSLISGQNAYRNHVKAVPGPGAPFSPAARYAAPQAGGRCRHGRSHPGNCRQLRLDPSRHSVIRRSAAACSSPGQLPAADEFSHRDRAIAVTRSPDASSARASDCKGSVGRTVRRRLCLPGRFQKRFDSAVVRHRDRCRMGYCYSEQGYCRSPI